jgi:hypothetical protein
VQVRQRSGSWLTGGRVPQHPRTRCDEPRAIGFPAPLCSAGDTQLVLIYVLAAAGTPDRGDSCRAGRRPHAATAERGAIAQSMRRADAGPDRRKLSESSRTVAVISQAALGRRAMSSQLAEPPTARKLPAGPGRGPGRRLTALPLPACQCPASGCSEQIDPSRLMCRRHWHQVPRHQRDLVWATWRSGAGALSFEHLEAVRQAIAAS